jgi:carboxyl-terminal processing protease
MSHINQSSWKRKPVRNRSTLFQLVLASLTGLLLASLAFGSGFVVASIRPRQSYAGAAFNAPQIHESDGASEVFFEAWELIARDFFGPLPSNRDRVYGAVRGVLETLDDPYTVLVEPVPHQFEQDDLRGSYGGVGLALNRGADGQVLVSPMRDSPAAQAGVQEGDILLTVDDLSITPKLDISRDIAAKIRGEVGTDVTLTIQRGDETLVFTITRQVIETPSVTWRMLDETPTLGYVQIKSFTDRTVDELNTALQELVAADASALVLDLRDNGGGLLQSAIDVADQFLKGGVVLYENRRGEPEKTYNASEDGEAIDFPLAVLVNQGTASASEIVAGALQDRDRGPLIGESTFGKGSVQLIFDLSDGSSLHVTAARWYTPNRHQLDAVGLTPDFVVESSTDTNADNDSQLERAIMFLQTGR